MANEYFQPGSVPSPNAPGSSAVIRQEFSSIALGFDKLPVLAGHAGEIVTINGSGTGLITSGAIITDYVTKAGVFTLTNKTIAWADNTFPGFGTGATKNAGTLAGNVLLLVDNNKLPALDGSLLTNLNINQAGTIVDIAHGGTGAATVESAQIALGINLKADANNAVLSGAPTAPNPPTGNDSARIATTHFVQETVTAIGGFAPGAASPQMNGAASAGVSTLGSREDHVHPVDTSRAAAAAATAAGTSFTPAGNIAATNVQSALQELDGEVYAALVVLDNQKANLASPTFTGDPTAPTRSQGDNDTSIATTAFVQTAIAPFAPLASPTFTGDPKAPTPLTSDNDTSIATTAFVQSLLAQQPPGVQVSNSTPLVNGVAAPGTGVEASRYDHVHPASNAAGTSFTPAGNIAATTVQAAIQELDSEKVGNTGLQTMGGPLIITDTSGQLAGFRNILINGSLAINQRGVTIAAAANGAYGPDRWKKVDASNMTQIVEAGNFKPSTTYTLSGTNVTTQQIASPASGNWTLPNIPITATNVQLEEGSIATPFELRPYGLELELCQRYYERIVTGLAGYVNAASGQIAPIATFKTEKRANPTIALIGNSVLVNVSSVTFDNISTLGARLVITATAAGTASLMSLYSAAAEL